MRPFFVRGSLFLVPCASCLVLRCSMMLVLGAFVIGTATSQESGTKNQEQRTKNDEPFRPEAGKFPPLEKAASYQGVLAFVDHANRRGSLRVETTGEFFRNPPHPFAL